MKMLVRRIETINKKGVSKKGSDYHIDNTTIVCDVPFNQSDEESTSFGLKEMPYQVGAVSSHKNYEKFGLDTLVDKLPIQLEVELGQGTNSYGQPQTVITEIKIPQQAKV